MLTVVALREILLSLMGSTTPCPNHFAHSFSREALDAHEATCPTVTHALVPELYAALDPDFLTIQVRRGVFGPSIFEMLGAAMKVHCAPVRDAMVDDMVSTATRGLGAPIALALRKCFDCVEVMKLVSFPNTTCFADARRTSPTIKSTPCGRSSGTAHLSTSSPRSTRTLLKPASPCPPPRPARGSRRPRRGSCPPSTLGKGCILLVDVRAGTRRLSSVVPLSRGSWSSSSRKSLLSNCLKCSRWTSGGSGAFSEFSSYSQ
jgi:hypothetical protein